MQQRNVSKGIKVPVSKPVHRSRSTNQSCVQRSRKSRNFEKVCYFVFKFLNLQHKISIALCAPYTLNNTAPSPLFPSRRYTSLIFFNPVTPSQITISRIPTLPEVRFLIVSQSQPLPCTPSCGHEFHALLSNHTHIYNTYVQIYIQNAIRGRWWSFSSDTVNMINMLRLLAVFFVLGGFHHWGYLRES